MKYILTATGLIFISAAVHAQGGPRDMFERLDADENEIVTHAELMSEAQRHFADFDADGNGVITLSELPEEMPLRERQKKRLERIKARQDARAERKGDDWQPRMSPEEIEERMTHSRLQFMARLDRDQNEELVLEEFAQPLIKRFKRADRDGDGSITLDEFENAQKRERGRKGRKHMRRQSN